MDRNRQLSWSLISVLVIIALAAIISHTSHGVEAAKKEKPLKYIPTLTPANFDEVIAAKKVPTIVLFTNSSATYDGGVDTTGRDYERIFRSFRHLPQSLFIAQFDVATAGHSEWAEDEFSVDTIPDLKLVRSTSEKFKTFAGDFDYRSMTGWITKKIRGIQPELDAPSSVLLVQDAFDLLHSLHTLAATFLASSDRAAVLAEARAIRERVLLTNYGVDMIGSTNEHITIMTNVIDNGWNKKEIKKEVDRLTSLSRQTSKPKAKKAVDDKIEIYASYIAAIPKIVHFIKTDSRRENFQLVHFLAVRSAAYWLSPTKIWFHLPEGTLEPTGEWWERARKYVEIKYAPMKYQTSSGKILKLAAHQSDFLRLDLLIEHGGIYLDWDVISTGPVDDVLSSAAVMGMEKKVPQMNEVMGVAAMMSRPGSAFMKRFRADMEVEFDGDKCYACHSTGLGRRLALTYPEEVRTINYTSWYHPGWEESAIRLLFDPTMYSAGDDISEGYFYGIHLFESHKNYQTWGVPAVKVDNLLNGKPTHFSQLVRKFLTDDDWKNFKKKK